jgi:hypothetical protein
MNMTLTICQTTLRVDQSSNIPWQLSLNQMVVFYKNNDF